MNSGQSERAYWVNRLLEFSDPIDEINEQLRKYSWDYEGAEEELTKENIIAVIKRFLIGEISGLEVERWANAIECRDDVKIEGGPESKVADVFFDLANPTLSQQLDMAAANSFLDTLGMEV